MRGLPSILSLFRNEFNKFNNTGARRLDSIYLSHEIKSVNHQSGLSILLHGIIALPEAMSCDK